jgi:predicted CXXCH cytochrome family protein
MVDEVKGGTVHESFAQGRCLTCHDEHASDNDYQLNKSGADNCYPCHESIQKASAVSPFAHDPVRAGECTSCHNPHGSRIKGQLNRPVGPLCLSCHLELSKKLEKDEVEHIPAQEGQCLRCHVPHYAKIESFVTDVGADLCRGCHDLKKPSMVDAHQGISFEKANCVGCHEAHSAGSKGLIHKVMHQPFKEGACVKCH